MAMVLKQRDRAGAVPYAKFILILGSVLVHSSCSALQQKSAIDKLTPCKTSDGPANGFCGSLDVPEDRQTNSGRKVSLKIVILPALKQHYAPDPLFFLAGGPGQGATELAGELEAPFHRIETDRDIVFVDQRGTGKSNPLACKPDRDEEDAVDPAVALVKRLRRCLDTYSGKADVTKYTTPIATDDLDDVRRFLGYSKINLYGISYGTRVAMVYAQRHAASTRAVVLDGVAPPDIRIPLYMGRDGQRALDLLFRDCEQDAGCNARFPHLRDRLKRLLDVLSAHPQHIRYVHPRTGIENDFDVKRLTVAGIIFASLYSPETAALIPLLVEQAEKGNFSGFLALGTAFDPLSENISLGMQFSVLCSEDASGIAPRSLDRESAGTFLGAEFAEQRLRPCEFWPRGQVAPAYFTNSPSDVPALILSGELDPVTPPAWGQEVASLWRNSRHIVVPATGHGTWSSGCVMKIIAQFLNEGNATKLDAACVSRQRRPPFFLGPSGPVPLTAGRK